VNSKKISKISSIFFTEETNTSTIPLTEEASLSEVVDFPILSFDEDLSTCVNFTTTNTPADMEPFNFYDCIEVDSTKKGESTSPSHLPPLVGSDFLDFPDLDPASLGSEEPSIDIQFLLNQQSEQTSSITSGGENQILDLLAQAVQSSEVDQADQPTSSATQPQMPVVKVDAEPVASSSLGSLVTIKPEQHGLDLYALNAIKVLHELETKHAQPAAPEPGAASPAGRNTLKATPPSKEAKSSSRRKVYEKGSEEYKQRRERNNVAVRKSRDKTKKQQAETTAKVKELSDENDQLQRKVDLLTKELTVLKGLFSNIGVKLPDQLKDFINK